MQHFVNDLKGYLSNQILNVTCSVEYRQLRSEKLGFCLFVCLFDYFFAPSHSRTSGNFLVSCLNSHWLLVIASLSLIGCCDVFCVGS